MSACIAPIRGDKHACAACFSQAAEQADGSRLFPHRPAGPGGALQSDREDEAGSTAAVTAELARVK